MRRLHRVTGVDPALAQRLAEQQVLTCRDAIVLSDLDLVEMLDVDLLRAREVLAAVCRAAAPARQELQQRRRRRAALPTLDADLNAVLRGGLPCGMVTEVVGPAGVGKTQFCLTAAVAAALGDDGSGVVYVDTEQAFSATRLAEIASHAAGRDADAVRRVAEAVRVLNVESARELGETLRGLEQLIVASRARLVVVDSIASLFRKDFGASSLIERTDLLASTASTLKHLSSTFSIPVLVTNQVTAKFDVAAAASDIQTEAGVAVPALGNTWSHAVNVRLALEPGPPARLRVVKSPMSPVTQLAYAIDAAGAHVRHAGGSEPVVC